MRTKNKLAPFLFLSFALLINAPAFADSYKVVKVLGTIIQKKTGAVLQQGDVIQSTDPIIFKSPDAKASVISAEKGRFVLSASSQNNSSASVKGNLLPPMSNISSRGGAVLNVTDLKNNFGANFLVLKEVGLSIARNVFAMNDSCFFYFTYKYNNEDINKKLKHKGDTLLIVEKDLFLVDGKPVSHTESTFVKMNYRSGKNSNFIGEFNIITPPNETIVKEVKMILDESSKKTYSEKVNDVVSYFNEFYGKTDEDNVKQWLKENFALSK